MERRSVSHDRWSAELADPLCESTDALALRLAVVPFRRFAVVGDSLSAGTGEHAPGYQPLGWSDRVARALAAAHPDAAYLNTAVVGATSGAALRDQSAEIRSFEPDLLHVPSAANDITAREPDYARIEDDLRRLYDLAPGAVRTTFTFGTYDVAQIPDFQRRVERVNDLVRSLAREHDAVLIDMAGHPVNQRPGLVGADGIHFSTMGQAVLATEVVRALVAHAPGPKAARS